MKLDLKVQYSKKALNFISKNVQVITEEDVDNVIILAVKKLFKLEESSIDVKPLKGNLKGTYRIRKGKLRITFIFKEKTRHGSKTYVLR